MFIARKPFPLPASFGGADTPWYTGGEAVPPSERSSAWWSLGAINMSLLRSTRDSQVSLCYLLSQLKAVLINEMIVALYVSGYSAVPRLARIDRTIQ